MLEVTRAETEAASVFEHKRTIKSQSVDEAELFEQIGRLKMEREWLKKKVGWPKYRLGARPRR